MSQELAAIYDRDFFASYGAANPDYARACRFIAAEIYRRFRPRTAVDWGCGAGVHAGTLHRLGVAVHAFDAVLAPPDLRDPDIVPRFADLTRPVAAEQSFPRYDLSLCIEVLEHVAPSDSATALTNITRGAGALVLSCAPPGQSGHHHVNERPRRYWVARLAELGWRYDRRATGALERHFLGHRDQLPWSWMYHNLCIYRPTRPVTDVPR